MNPFQPIYDVAALCALRGIHYAVLCPGSRCAPLTLAFTRHPDMRVRTFSDERSAGFVALGLAQETRTPSVLVCTSGSAAYNFAPAVAEAFFSETPVLVFTADRPPEWIAQHDGQTIFQTGLFGKHVKKSFDLPADYGHPDSVWAINRIVNEAITLSLQEPAGPVHINMPFREPLYPGPEDTTAFSPEVRVIENHSPDFVLTQEDQALLARKFFSFSNVLVVAGQQESDPPTLNAVNQFQARHKVPVAGDIISNLHPLENVVRLSDTFLGQAGDEVKKRLKPDLLITYGKSVISKNLKLFLRRFKPLEHWHIQPGGIAADTFQTLTSQFQVSPAAFFGYLSSLERGATFENQKQENFFKLWEVEERRARRALEEFFPQPDLGELEFVREVLSALPEGANLHLANSMSVRYANLLGLPHQSNVAVYANRGTSGIDGSTSTAVGHALENSKPNILITGDLAFFYDRNAFWHNYPLPNLRIVLLNNHGGIIFGMIDGPGDLPEAREYFVTRQDLNAKKLCEEFDFDHLKLDHRRKLKNLLKDFFEFDGRTKVLELESDLNLNKDIFTNLKQKIKKSYEH